MLLYLVEHYGPGRLIAHYQILPEDWPETLPYVQDVCTRLGVPLVAQQMVYEPVGNGTGVRRMDVIDVAAPGDIVPWGTPGAIAGITDLALRRQWPPTPGCRFGTAYFKVRLLDWWIIQQQRAMALGSDVIVALGERWAESPRRAKKVELWPRPRCQRKTYRVWNWLPMIAWSRRQTFRRMRDWDIEPHPAYRAQGMADWQMYDVDAEGGPRTGCRACLYASHVDLCHQALVEANRGLFERVHLVEQATGRTWWIDRRTARQYLDGAFRVPVSSQPSHYQPSLLT
jgi:hypothetical protein